MTGATIGVVAKRAGVGVETVRFYERRGLIAQPRAPRNGFRQYPEEVIERIRFIRHAKDLGFTLGEIGELLSLRSHPRINCDSVHRKTQRKIDDVNAKMASLRKIKLQLEKLSTACERREATADCPVLEALK